MLRRRPPSRSWHRRSLAKHRMPYDARSPLQIERLESRTLLSTLSIDGSGVVSYSATATVANDLTISRLGGNYVFTENAESINVIGTGASNCAGSGTGIVTCDETFVSSISVDAGDGHDTITVESLIDPATISGGTGNDTVDAATAETGLTIDGGSGNDSIVGGTAGDSLNGGIGDDNINGGGGDDTITGDSGNDTLAGGDGTDRLIEAADTDFALTNTSLSGLGSDSLSGIERTQLTGGAGNNTIDASAFTGSVTLNGAGGNDSVAGGSGADSLTGGDGDDTITGGLANDTLVGGSGNDSLVGGGGTDTGDFSAAPAGVRVALKSGSARGDGKDRLREIEAVLGSAFGDQLSGNSLANRLVGGGGNDRLTGLDGDDTLEGGLGNDRLDGGLGNDLLLGGDGDDFLIGHRGRDIIIGGAHNDNIFGVSEDDIVIAGTTDHDANLAALDAIMAEWTSARDYATRVADITDGSGSTDRVNGAFFLTAATVDDDAASDRLFGGSETDWFFVCTAGPKKDVFDRLVGETLADISPP